METIAIIGGGAAGLAAAVAAGEAARARGCAVRVVVYEASDRVGRSILATGNGRCNFSNAVVDAARYRNGAFVAAALEALEEAAGAADAPAPEAGAAADGAAGAAAGASGAAGAGAGSSNAVLRFFADHGLLWRRESEGRLYPLANKATSVLDVLRAAAAAVGAQERCGIAVAAVEPPRGAGRPFTLRLADGRLERAAAVIVAVGGALPAGLLPAELPVAPPQPTLGPLATEARWCRRLDNIRVRGVLELRRDDALRAREPGEVMFRKYGVSGIAAFNLSRLAQPGDVLAVDFVPAVEAAAMADFLRERCCRLDAVLGRAATWDDMLCGMVLGPVAEVLLDAAGLCGGAPVATGEVPAMAAVLKGLRLPVTGLGDPRQCQVHRGGLQVSAVDAATCAVVAAPGLFVVGEALDVDAPCGGYNLHWAWASGLLAGRAAVARMAGRPESKERAR